MSHPNQCSKSEIWNNPQRAAFPDCHRDLSLFKVAVAILQSGIEFVFLNRSIIILSIVLCFFVFILYKSYWSPVSLEKGLFDYGFESIPKGPDRNIRAAREMKSRNLGVKVPPPYPNGWFAVAESRGLKKGGVISTSAVGHNVCVYRGEDGVARCVGAYCPHLGAHLGVGGRVAGNCIECPFHKWRFGAGGECVSAHGLEKPPRVTLKTWTTVELNGAVWVWYDAEGRGPLWTMQEHEETRTWGYRGRNEFIVGSHVMDIPENGADVLHFNTVHGPSVFTEISTKYPFLNDYIGRHTWTADWAGEEGQPARMDIYHKYKFGKFSFAPMEFITREIYPGSATVHFNSTLGPMLILQSVTPIGPLKQRVVHRFYSPWYNAPYAVAILYGEVGMFIRDIRIWNHKQYQHSPAYGRHDKWIKSFRGWFMQFYSENSLSFNDAAQKSQNNLDW